MKNTMKKVLAILVSVMLVFSLSVVAFAAGEGSITVTNAAEGETYSAYRILSLESYDATTGIYLYKADSNWAEFVAAQTTYLSVDASGYVTWVEGADEKAFAKAALAYAEANNITATDSVTVAEGATAATISGLDLGYYLVDSTLGTILALTTTKPDATFAEKNSGPTIYKEVKEDSTGAWGTENDADMFQTIEFRATITAQAGATKYVLHDTMSEGLTFNGVTGVTLGGETVDASNYTVTSTGLTDGCTFEVSFEQEFLDTLEDNDVIVVSYEGELNENAAIHNAVNTNDVYLAYGDASETETSTTETSTYEFDIVKTDSNNNLIDGAEFRLYDALEGGNEIAVVELGDGFYRVADDSEAGVAITTLDGIATIIGLDGDTNYYLEETKAPAGYNGLTSRVQVSITNENLKAEAVNGEYTPETGVQIVNKTGSIFPETGGIGTTIFTIVGIVLVLGAGILLVVKKRAASAE